jgi:hypothetical protein
VTRIQSDLKIITTFMNTTSIILFFLIIYNNAHNLEYIFKNFRSEKVVLVEDNHDLKTNLLQTEYPDIYFIILDGYGRDDTLSKYFDYDNQEFLTSLSNKGFYISSASSSNYMHTFISLASNLNMDFMDDIAAKMGTTTNNIFPFLQGIQHNRLMEFLASQGYRTIAFQSGFHATEMDQVDNYFSGTSNLTEYDTGIINLTPLRILLINFSNETRRKRIRYTFDLLTEIDQSDQPTFVFAHIIAPHEPFIFGPNGEKRNPDPIYHLLEDPTDNQAGRQGFINGYNDQVTYLNSLILDTVDKIFSKPGKKPIIVIQGDHGPIRIWSLNDSEIPNVQTTFPILNVIYFPDQDYSNLYPDISSVNTFRLILDKYFGTQLGLLEDKSYFSTVDRPYDFIDVTDQIENPD